jgi:hypothetical protein
MAKQRPIKRVDSKRKSEYERLVKNAKSKVRSIKKKFGDRVTVLEEGTNGELTPVTKKVEDLVNIPRLKELDTWEQFHETIDKLSSFTNRNNTKFQFKKNKYNVVASKNLLNTAERDTKRAQRRADEENKKNENKPIISDGKIIGTYGQLQKMQAPSKINRPANFNFGNMRNNERLRDVVNNMHRKADPSHYNRRAEKMRDTYIRELYDAFNSDADYLVSILKAMNPEDFLEMYKIEDAYDFQLFYIMKYMDEAENLGELGRITRIAEKYASGQGNFDMRNF